MAVTKGHRDVVYALLEGGANIHAVPGNQCGQRHASSLIEVAAGVGHGDVIRLLTQAWVFGESRGAQHDTKY